MTQSSMRGLALALAFVPLVSVRAHSQVAASALTRMQSPSHTERRAGFYTLLAQADSEHASEPMRALRLRVQAFAVYVTQHPEVGRAVIDLLEHENAHPESLVSEDPYHGDLIAAVAALGDPSAVDALMGAIGTGELATRGLAMLGDAAVPSVMAAAPSARTRVSALITLSEMVTATPVPPLSSQNRVRIRATLIEALSDSNRFARETALEGLAAFSDSAVRDAVARVAASDPFVVHDGGRVRYPVREAAAATLRRLDEKGR